MACCRNVQGYRIVLCIILTSFSKDGANHSNGLPSWEDLELIADQSECPPPTHQTTCLKDIFGEFRSISGVCNNRQNPFWGASNIALARWLPAEYEDRARQPKGWNHGRLYNGFPLPPVHKVSKNIIKSSNKQEDVAYTQMLVDWGQYIDHDMTFTSQSKLKAAFYEEWDCFSKCKNVNPCFPIELFNQEENGTLSGENKCFPFIRSSPACFTDNTAMGDIKLSQQRKQMNSITSFIDASTVYGNTPKLQNSIRNLSSNDGRLAVNKQFTDQNGQPYLPFIVNTPSPCFQDPEDPEGELVDCFLAGDSRVNEGLPLIILHTLWMREHNRIAEALKSLNCHWSAETIYQETRKIIGALHQVIHMRDYVPKIIGTEAFGHYIGPYMRYDPTMDPSVSNIFATAAFRFGHATLSAVLSRLNESFEEDELFPSLSLHKSFFSPWRLVKEGGLEPVLRGLIGKPAATVTTNKLLSEELTERLVVLNIPNKLDLAAINLQRGRDHALPGYNDWRTFCGLQRIETQDDLMSVVRDEEVAQKIMKMYGHPDNIDVWLGGLVEEMLPGSRTGPLFACLIGRQMNLLRGGDRFWWENEGVFTKQQRTELLNYSLSRLVCENTEVSEVPLDSFKMGPYPADFLSCSYIPSMSLEAWREKV